MMQIYYFSSKFNLNALLLFPIINKVLLFILSICIGRILTKFAHIAFLSVENRLMNHAMGFFLGMVKGATILISFVWFATILVEGK